MDGKGKSGRSRRLRAALSGLFVAWAALPGLATAQTEAPSGATIPTTTNADHVPATDYQTARMVGMGLGGRAGALSTTAAVTNAANLALMRLYHVETMVQYMPGVNAWSFGGAFADSVTGKLAAGIVSRGILSSGSLGYSGYDMRLSMGTALSNQLGLGFGLRYLKLTSDRHAQDGQPKADEAKGFTMDASFRLTAFEGFNIALLGYNLIPMHTSLAPLRLGGGVSYAYENVLDVSFDLLVDLTTGDETSIVLGGGIQYLAGGVLPLRIGYSWDSLRDWNTMGGSIGYVDRRLSVDVAIRKSFHVDDATVNFTFRYHVQ